MNFCSLFGLYRPMISSPSMDTGEEPSTSSCCGGAGSGAGAGDGNSLDGRVELVARAALPVSNQVRLPIERISRKTPFLEDLLFTDPTERKKIFKPLKEPLSEAGAGAGVGAGASLEGRVAPCAIAALPSSDQVMLPSGRILTEETFLDDPLFKYTPERKGIFKSLKEPLNDYMKTLYSQIINPDFSNPYLFHENPRLFAILATLAYFDKEINAEELMVLHMLAQSHQTKWPDNVTRVIIGPDGIEDYLTKAHFPPFTPNVSEYMITNRKIGKELGAVKEEIKKEWSKRSIKERMVIEYRQSKSTDSVSMSIYRKGHRVGIKEDLGLTVTSVLLPPIFSVKLAQWTSCVHIKPAEDHVFMFGHDSKLGAIFYNGIRVISIASPLVEEGIPHGFSGGALQLEMQLHDTNYHIPLEYNNPHVDLFCDLAAYFNPKRNPSLLGDKPNQKLKQISFAFAKDIVDRECLMYDKRNLTISTLFWHVLAYQFSYVMLHHATNSWSYYKYLDVDIEKWGEKILFPGLYSFLKRKIPLFLFNEKCLSSFRVSRLGESHVYDVEQFRGRVLAAGASLEERVAPSLMIALSFSDQVRLPSGKILTKETFLACPLFKYTPEREAIFNSLNITLTSDEKYLFEQIIAADFSNYTIFQENPRLGAILATLAYFDEKIKIEELMVLHMIAQSYEGEWPASAKRVIISPEAIGDYLTKAHFPPFINNDSIYIMANRKSDEELEVKKQEIIENWSRRSSIERTVIEYSYPKVTGSLGALSYTVGCRLGIKDENEDRITSVLLPPIFAAQLVEFTSAGHSMHAGAQLFMFGYDPMLVSPYYEGTQIIPIASPLVRSVMVDGFSGLDLKMENQLVRMNYYLPFYYNNPHRELFCQLATHFSPERNPDLFSGVSEKLQKVSGQFAEMIVDTEFVSYANKNNTHVTCFWQAITTFVMRSMMEKTSVRFQGNSYLDSDIREWVVTFFLPHFYEFLNEKDPTLLDCSESLISFMVAGHEGKIYNTEAMRRAVLAARPTHAS